MGCLKSSALLSSSYLPFTSTPTDPSSSSSTGNSRLYIFSARRTKAASAPASPAPPTPCSHRLPACPGAPPSQRLGRRRHFRIPGASALPVRSPPRALRSGRPEPRARRQRGCGPSEAGVVPGSESPFPPRQPVGPRSGHIRKWRGTRAAR